MVDYTLRVATRVDATRLAPRLREMDKMEIDAGIGRSHVVALERSIRLTPTPIAIDHGGEVAGLFGVAELSLTTTTGSPWFLGSDDIDENPREFLKMSKEFVHVWQNRYTLLQNYVYAGHTQSIRWLSWLGFTIHEAEPRGPMQSMFHRFSMRGSNV